MQGFFPQEFTNPSTLKVKAHAFLSQLAASYLWDPGQDTLIFLFLDVGHF